MGRRARERERKGAAPSVSPAPAAPRRGARERPKAPWDPFPLVELSALIGIVCLVVGLFQTDEREGRMLIVTGMVLGSLAGLDTTLREHFSGFRSHSTVIAALPAVLVTGGLYFAETPYGAMVVGAVATFTLTFLAARRAFRRRSGGLSFR